MNGQARGHAVFFPDVGDANALSRPDMPPAVIGCAKNLQGPKAWVDAVFAYWGRLIPVRPSDWTLF
jgi:hypothetical protein